MVRLSAEIGHVTPRSKGASNWLNETPSGTLARLVISCWAVARFSVESLPPRLPGSPRAWGRRRRSPPRTPRRPRGRLRSPPGTTAPPGPAILDFLAAATDEGNDGFVPMEDRIATFDQDGCLWVEHPIYGQAIFAIDRVKALAPDHPDWATTAPYDAILSGDQKAIESFTEQDWEQIIGATHAGMTVEEFHAGRRRVGGHGEGSALRPALHPAGLPADARSPEPAARKRLPYLHRLRRRAGASSVPTRRMSTASHRSRSSAPPSRPPTAMGMTARRR